MLRRIVGEHRLALVVVVSMLVANVAGYLLLVRPLAARVSGVEERRTIAEEALRAAEADLAAARGLVSGFERARADLDRFHRSVLPASLNDANRMTYLRLAQMAREHHLRFRNRTFAAGALRETGYQTLKTVIDLEGDYGSIRRLIHGIETAREFLVIDRVALGAGRDAGGPLAVTLELSTFYETPGHAR